MSRLSPESMRQIKAESTQLLSDPLSRTPTPEKPADRLAVLEGEAAQQRKALTKSIRAIETLQNEVVRHREEKWAAEKELDVCRVQTNAVMEELKAAAKRVTEATMKIEQLEGELTRLGGRLLRFFARTVFSALQRKVCRNVVGLWRQETAKAVREGYALTALASQMESEEVNFLMEKNEAFYKQTIEEFETSAEARLREAEQTHTQEMEATVQSHQAAMQQLEDRLQQQEQEHSKQLADAEHRCAVTASMRYNAGRCGGKGIIDQQLHCACSRQGEVGMALGTSDHCMCVL